MGPGDPSCGGLSPLRVRIIKPVDEGEYAHRPRARDGVGTPDRSDRPFFSP
jgi:hypothetical protein